MNCLCANTRRAARSLTRLYEEHLRPANMTPAQFNLLSLLSVRQGLSQVQLAGELALDQTTLSRNLQLLIANKWLKRTRSNEDRRQVVYALTAAGLEAQRKALPQWQKAQETMRRALGADWESALALLRRLDNVAAQ